MLQVYSHPRSGTHFLTEVLSQVFYAHEDLSNKNYKFGHWSKRKTKDINKNAELFGGHEFGSEKDISNEKAIYLYRDGRSVLASLYNAPDLIHDRKVRRSFKKFIRNLHDFVGSPGRKADPPFINPIEHWKLHVESWKVKNVLFVSYEDLYFETDKVINMIANHFSLIKKSKFNNEKFYGPDPTSQKDRGYWTDYFDNDDLIFFHQFIPRDYKFLYEGFNNE